LPDDSIFCWGLLEGLTIMMIVSKLNCAVLGLLLGDLTSVLTFLAPSEKANHLPEYQSILGAERFKFENCENRMHLRPDIKHLKKEYEKAAPGEIELGQKHSG